MKKKIAVTMGLSAVALTGGVVLVSMEDDKKGPDIIFESQPVYTGEEDVSYLLEGVKAVDLKDEDVTDSLRVEKIQVNRETQEVVVIYIAKDHSNNVSKVSITLPLNGVEVQTEKTSEPETVQTFAEVTPEATPEATPEPTPETVVLSGEAENEAKIAALSPGCPALYLKQYEEKLAVGSSFNLLGYVQEITDDVDDRSWLFQHIQVAGEVNSYTPGVYEMIYYVIDSDGNQSNEAKLTVTVE